MAKSEFHQVRESFIVTIGKNELEYHKGDLVDAADPALKKFPHLFEELALRGHIRVSPEPDEKPVEKATAAPGEKRGEGKALTTASLKGKAK